MGRAIIKKYQTKKKYSGYIRTEYTQANSGSYICTGIVPNTSTDSSEMIMQSVGQFVKGIFGKRNTSSGGGDNYYWLGIDGGNCVRWVTLSWGDQRSIALDGKKLKLTTNGVNGKIYYDDGTLVFDANGQSISGGRTIDLFTVNDQNNGHGYFAGNTIKCFEFKWMRNGKIIYHLVPVRREGSSTAGFLDITDPNNPMWVGPSSGGFTAGPDLV